MESYNDFFQFSNSMNMEFNIDSFFTDDESSLGCVVGTDVSFASLSAPDTDNGLLCHAEKLEFDDLATQTDTVKSKKLECESPWHESDSGVSDTISFLGSPDDQNKAANTFQTEIVLRNNFKSGNIKDDDLMSYLFGTPVNNEPDVISLEKLKSDLDASARKSCSGPQGRPLEYDASDSETSTCDSKAYYKENRFLKAYVAHKKEPPQSKNVINIVKIVKSQSSTSETSNEEIIKALDERSKKNAQQAKINREKKKLYIKTLEDDFDHIRKENSNLTSQVANMSNLITDLKSEVEYLRAVLQNSSALSGLLKNICNVTEVKLSSSFSRKRPHESDHSYNIVESEPSKRQRPAVAVRNTGVCLHVRDGEASLEFCSRCASLADKNS